MSVLREMAEELAKRLDAEAEFFLVVQNKIPDPETGIKHKVILTNVDMPVVEVEARGREVVNG